MAILPSDPAQQKRLLIGILPLFLLFVYWQFYHGGLTDAIAEQEARLERLERNNTTARAQAAQSGSELQQRLALYEEHVTRLEQLIPTSDEVPQLLHDMSVRAQETGVDLALMRPQQATPGPYYTLHTYEITVIGAFHDVGRYLTAVGSLPRIVTPIDLRLMRRPAQAGQGGGGAALEASFRIQTYVLPAESRTEAAPNART